MVGIAYPDERDLSDAHLAELLESAGRLPA